MGVVRRFDPHAKLANAEGLTLRLSGGVWRPDPTYAFGSEAPGVLPT